VGLKGIVEELWPLHRTLASDGTDRALEIIGDRLPESAEYTIESYPPGEPAWTWRVPERYVVHEAYLEIEGGKRVVDFADSPLHLVSYSLPTDLLLTWEELEPHLYFSADRPRAVPWQFKYYERSWGFCLTKEKFDSLPRDGRYRAVIRSEFLTDPEPGFRLGVATVHPQGGRHPEAGEFIVCSHICHPHQANDDASGVATAIGVANRLADRPLAPESMSVRFLFCPETVGTICYLSHHPEVVSRLKGGVFCEMTGNRNSIVLQRTRQDKHVLDAIGRSVLRGRNGDFREGAFRQVIMNDEFVINGPGVNVPCISISRWPYDEYHTSDDNPDIIFEDMLKGAADVVEEVARIYCENYVPRRTFKGPAFLSGHGLWVDWQANPDLNQSLDEIMLRLEGQHSVFDIARELELDYQEVRDYMERFRSAGLVEATPMPGPADDDGVRA